MSTPTAPPVEQSPTAELIAQLQQLSPQQLAQVQTFVQFLLYQQEKKANPPISTPTKRTPGLHQGAVIYIADDFDDDLGDDFWLPDNDILLEEQEQK